MSTFAVGGTTATFRINGNGFKHVRTPPAEISATVDVDSDVEFDNLAAGQSWGIHIDRAGGGNSVWVDVASGAGEGVLNAEDLGLWTAVLSEVAGGPPLNSSGARLVSCKFLITGTP